MWEAVIFMGLQGSGKSSFYFGRFRDTHLRINLDMLRTRHREAILLRCCLEMKQPFVIDNTNPRKEDRARYIPAAQEAGFRAIGYYFEPDLRGALERNALRSGRARIPDVGVKATMRALEPPTLEEGFAELYRVRLEGDTFNVLPYEVDSAPQDAAANRLPPL